VTSQRPARAIACAAGLLLAAPAPAAARPFTDYMRLIESPKHVKAKKVSRRAKLTKTGRAITPPGAPRRVRQIIRAGNRIAHKPYMWGGGHGTWQAAGYDCSGSVSYALHGGGLLEQAVASGGLASFGKAGKGKWVTVYAHGGHARAGRATCAAAVASSCATRAASDPARASPAPPPLQPAPATSRRASGRRGSGASRRSSR